MRRGAFFLENIQFLVLNDLFWICWMICWIINILEIILFVRRRWLPRKNTDKNSSPFVFIVCSLSFASVHAWSVVTWVCDTAHTSNCDLKFDFINHISFIWRTRGGGKTQEIWLIALDKRKKCIFDQCSRRCRDPIAEFRPTSDEFEGCCSFLSDFAAKSIAHLGS